MSTPVVNCISYTLEAIKRGFYHAATSEEVASLIYSALVDSGYVVQVMGRHPDPAADSAHPDGGYAVDMQINVPFHLSPLPIRDLVNERSRQILVEGYTAKHDGSTYDGAAQLAGAAACYALAAASPIPSEFAAPHFWPWPPKAWKPKGGTRRCLVKSGALALAALEQLDRLALQAKN